MGLSQSSQFPCYFCKTTSSYPLSCGAHGGCESCLFNYFSQCLSTENMSMDLIPCVYCRIPIGKKLIKFILTKYSIEPCQQPVFKTREEELASRALDHNFECLICYEMQKGSKGYKLSCGDDYCQLCISLIITDAIRNNKPALCPKCHKKIKDSDIINNTSEEVNEIYQLSLIKQLDFDEDLEKLMICPFCELGFTVPKQETSSRCPGCSKEFCYRCYTHHPGQVCNLPDKIEGVTNCPKCGEGIMKTGGCNFISCR